MSKKEDSEQITVEQLGESLFISAHTAAKSDFQNKIFLKGIGVKQPDTIVLLELLILNLFAIMKGIEHSAIPGKLKTLLADEMHDAFFIWLGKLVIGEETLQQVKNTLVHRYKEYENAYKKIFEESSDSTMIEASEIIFKNLRTILSSELTTENIFDLLPLHSMFTHKIIELSKVVAEIINKVEIIFEE